MVAATTKAFQVLVLTLRARSKVIQPVREAVSYRGLFTAGWFGVREKHCSRLEIYDRASEQAVYTWKCSLFSGKIWSRKKIYLLPGFDAS